MIPPLIPLPSSRPDNDAQEDLFATLFTPSTPRASPTLGPIPDRDPQPKSFRHSRTASVDSDFGAFVSVSSTEDPLSPQLGEDGSSGPFSPLQNLEFFDRFAEDARAATERNKKGVLNELLEHEDDPLYFLHDSTTPSQPRSGVSTPIPTAPAQPSLLDLSPTAEFWNTKPLPPDDAVHGSAPPSVVDDVDEPLSRHPTRQANHTEPMLMHPPLTRTPSLPPSPAKASLPEVQPAQSIFASSSFTASTFPKKWVSSLLSRSSSRRSPSIDEIDRRFTTDRHTPSPPSSVPSHSRIQSASAGVEVSTAITHGTPFAPEVYVPPSGAPGFTGDRTWNTGGFEYEKENVEKKSVRLVGRKEITTPVMTSEIADMVSVEQFILRVLAEALQIRPHLPALSRLPMSWSLLYSLDQHGISLNTLYTRCDSHTGGAIVIMRDSENALFGAWVGEGIHHSKGAYYGGGES